MRALLVLALASSLSLPAAAQTVEGSVPTAPGLAGASLPPLLDREVFFGNPEIAAAQLSPDGRWLSFLKPLDGVLNLWVKGVDEPFEAARPLTADTRPVPGYFWSRDGRAVLYVQDRGGDENFHVYAVDPATATGDGAPPARNLTDIDGVRAMIVAVPESDPGHILVGLNGRDAAWHDVYRVNLATGERTLLIENTERIAGWLADQDGAVRIGLRTAADGSAEILPVTDGALGEVVYTCAVTESCYPVRVHPDGRVYLVTDKGDRDLMELVLLDPATGGETLVERDPEGQVDFGGAVFSERTDELLATVYEGDRLRIYPRDEAWGADLAFLRERLPDGEVRPGSETADERTWLVHVVSDVDPGTTYLFDRDSREITRLYRGRPEVPVEHMAPMQPVRYTARDGREIPAYLTLPRGAEPRNLPAVLLIHGGPWARDSWGYDAYAQFLANRGYAVLQPNFRGSTGYGKDHLNAGNGQWGTGAMQHDLTDGAQWLIAEGIADPERVGIMGGSYGGYATLAGLAFTPDLYAAGVDIVGPSNLLTLLETIPPYWEAVRTVFHERMGNPEIPEQRERLVAQSPLFSADAITAPLLIIQGANDPRVRQSESDQIVIALRDRGYPVRYLVATDEGHGFRDEINQLAQNAATEAFLAQHLGGRAQTDLRPEITERLARLSVDPATVTYTPPSAAPAAGTPAFDGARLAPHTLRYQSRMAIGGQTIEMEATRTVEAATDGGREVWRLVETATTPMGAVSDSLWLDRTTLAPLRRVVHQGPARIALAYAPDAVTGGIEAPGQTIPYNLALEAPLAIEGASIEVALGTLTLADGMRAAFAGLDLMQQRPQTTTVEVDGSESVTTPAGTVDAWVVRLTVGDDGAGGRGTLWVDRATGHVVRSERQLPAMMGSGTATSELVAAE